MGSPIRLPPKPPAPRTSRTLLLRRKSFQRTLHSVQIACHFIGTAAENERRSSYNARQTIGSVCLKLVEEYAGVGSLRCGNRTLAAIPYRISRFQGMAISGLPIPGLHRIEGTLALKNVPAAAELVGADVTLELEDGRSLALTVADDSGRVLAEGHGPKRGCGCC
jgi:hypothetical protein